jgi:uncharacterized membrane protein
MAHLKKSIVIQAPVNKVFEYMFEPTNLPEVWPSMVEVKDIQRPPDRKYNFHWKYKMAGMVFDGATQTESFVQDQQVVSTSSGGIRSRFVWDYQPEDGGTRLSVNIEYTVPIPLVGKLAEAAIVKMNEREADTLLANLKTRMES